MEVLKIATAGSVDDGKSTLIGRLLYDTKSLTTDKLEAIENKSKQLGYDYLDFSLATDGLVAEREQGITIDVAHIYFSTLKKSYIIADTPGHVEYTRNMVTGASTSEASIILIDARKGVIEQTYRHFFINNLLRIKTIFVAINKMDLVDYNEDVYETIKAEFKALMSKRDFVEQEIVFVPISALKGDNVVLVTDKMSWYNGKPLLGYLEELKPQNQSDFDTARFPVQSVIRPKTEEFHDFRGYAGKVNGGDLAVGDAIFVLPSLRESKIKEIHFYDKKVDVAVNKSSVLITLEDDINISRGDMIVKSKNLPKAEKEFTATVSWMDSETLNAGNKYILQHGVNKVITKIKSINHKIHTDYSGIENKVETLVINDIASVNFKTNKPIFYDAYKTNTQNGAFILIDHKTNNTVGAGFID